MMKETLFLIDTCVRFCILPQTTIQDGSKGKKVILSNIFVQNIFSQRLKFLTARVVFYSAFSSLTPTWIFPKTNP